MVRYDTTAAPSGVSRRAGQDARVLRRRHHDMHGKYLRLILGTLRVRRARDVVGLAHPSYLNTRSASKHKANLRDFRSAAHRMRMNGVPVAYALPKNIIAVRNLCRSRCSMCACVRGW